MFFQVVYHDCSLITTIESVKTVGPQDFRRLIQAQNDKVSLAKLPGFC